MCCSPRKWLRAFTFKETIYTIAEAVLLLILILFLVYLVMHFSVCSKTQKSKLIIKGRSRINNTELPRKLENGKEVPNIFRQWSLNTEDGNDDISTVTDDTTESVGEDDNDISAQGKVIINDTIIVISNATNWTIGSSNKSTNFKTTKLDSRSASFVRPRKLARSVTVSSGIQEQKIDEPSEAEEITFYVDYYEDEVGLNKTIPTKVKHCKKCAKARREHARGLCDCGDCASNRTVRHKTRTLNYTVTVNVTRTGAVTPSLSGALTSPLPGTVTSSVPGTVATPVLDTVTEAVAPQQRFIIKQNKFTEDMGASELHKSVTVALVRAERDSTFTYVCVSVLVAESWALCAAACIADLRPDTLGLHFLVERFGEAAAGDSHGVREAVRGDAGGGGHVLALRAGDSLLARGGRLARVASHLDRLLLVLGETFTALGYGNFRSIKLRDEDLRLRQTCINWVLEEACGGVGVGGGGDGTAMCGGVLYGSQAPCYFCAGTPLFRGDVLFALATGERETGCGVQCPPRRYVSTAGLGEWLEDMLRTEWSEGAATTIAGRDDYGNEDY